MLVLTVEINDPIHIYLPDGREILVRVTRTGREGTRIGIEAPSDVKILRHRLLRKDEKDA